MLKAEQLLISACVHDREAANAHLSVMDQYFHECQRDETLLELERLDPQHFTPQHYIQSTLEKTVIRMARAQLAAMDYPYMGVCVELMPTSDLAISEMGCKRVMEMLVQDTLYKFTDDPSVANLYGEVTDV